ncbi:hypothetical protein [Nocardia terpenica]|uniref:Uncharacterized protein n=1 Tax=Nocardia terpenica TaxID=455432 RepID=A0A164LT96_9NOCA|nr:hypothetical protein [Nocardia terpenica]KZM72723.1 hypothetical protein AWN90_28505 [Nocardia terpenica]
MNVRAVDDFASIIEKWSPGSAFAFGKAPRADVGVTTLSVVPAYTWIGMGQFCASTVAAY